MNKSFIKFITDFGPLLVFFSFYYKNEKNLIVAIPPFIVATIISLIVVWILEKKIPMVPLLGGGNYPTFAHVVLYPDMESVMQSKKVEAAEGGWRFRDEYETEYAECSDPMLMHEKVYNRPK